MKNKIIGLLLRLCSKKYYYARMGIYDYVVCYKVLFGQEYIFSKTLLQPRHYNCRCSNGVANNVINPEKGRRHVPRTI